ncbi:B-cell linker protein isoform X3 [Dendrobates tinctorius]|uniref:B-cell linker protein isoform X3 n=1 Tax=Dendrobates tinctorius TaxID=92724 RepID=UPI003CCA40D2
MAFKLPLREHFENWTTSQVADLFRQCGLQECTVVLEKLGLNGSSFLNMTDYELNSFNTIYKPQVQKMISDIKKNEPRLINRIKKITKQAPPTVPRRDYQTGPPVGEDDEWFDEFGSDYDSPDEHSDSEPYVVPIEGDGDNYEPPPNDNHVSPPVKIMMRSNGYADKPINMRQPPKPNEPFPKHQQPLPSVTSRPHIANKPLPKPLPSPRNQPTPSQLPAFKKTVGMSKRDPEEDEESYIVPDNGNYIEPTKDPPKKPPAVNRHNKPGPLPPVKSSTSRPAEIEDQDLYVVPESEPNPTPSPPTRSLLPPKVFPPSNTVQGEDDYEVCADVITSPPEPPVKPKPLPSPRNMRPKPPISLLPQKPKAVLVLPQRDISSNIEKPQVIQRTRIQSAGNEPPPLGPPVSQKLPFHLPKPNIIPVQRPPEVATRYIPIPSRHGSIAEQDADVLNKDWYVSSCDRQKAEDALTATSKDGSFLVRKSSRQDSSHPFTLVVFYKRRVYNIPVRYIEATRQYALGSEKSGEEKFNSVAQIIENHRQTPLVLIDSHNNTKDSTRLKQAVRIP